MVIKRYVSKGGELVKLTISCFIKGGPGSDLCDLVGCVAVSSWTPRLLRKRSYFTHHCLCTIRANGHTVKEAKKKKAVVFLRKGFPGGSDGKRICLQY